MLTATALTQEQPFNELYSTFSIELAKIMKLMGTPQFDLSKLPAPGFELGNQLEVLDGFANSVSALLKWAKTRQILLQFVQAVSGDAIDRARSLRQQMIDHDPASEFISKMNLLLMHSERRLRMGQNVRAFFEAKELKDVEKMDQLLAELQKDNPHVERDNIDIVDLRRSRDIIKQLANFYAAKERLDLAGMDEATTALTELNARPGDGVTWAVLVCARMEVEKAIGLPAVDLRATQPMKAVEPTAPSDAASDQPTVEQIVEDQSPVQPAPTAQPAVQQPEHEVPAYVQDGNITYANVKQLGLNQTGLLPHLPPTLPPDPDEQQEAVLIGGNGHRAKFGENPDN